MRFEEEEIYLLTVAQAKRRAKRHEEEESWDLWTDGHARNEARFNKTRISPEKDRKETGRRAS